MMRSYIIHEGVTVVPMWSGRVYKAKKVWRPAGYRGTIAILTYNGKVAYDDNDMFRYAFPPYSSVRFAGLNEALFNLGLMTEGRYKELTGEFEARKQRKVVAAAAGEVLTYAPVCGLKLTPAQRRKLKKLEKQ